MTAINNNEIATTIINDGEIIGDTSYYTLYQESYLSDIIINNINLTGSIHNNNNKANVYIKNGTIKSKIDAIVSQYGNVYIDNANVQGSSALKNYSGNIIVNNGIFESASGSLITQSSYNVGNITINGGIFNTKGYIVNADYINMTINGGTFSNLDSNNTVGFNVSNGGNLTINNETVINSTGTSIYIYGTSKTDINIYFS